MDGEERKIALLIAAFDQEREHTAQATAALRQVIESLGEKVDSATGVAVGKALNTLRREADLAAQAMQKLRRLTLWQSAWRHVTTALCAMAITVLAVWWYVPTVGEMSALRAERSAAGLDRGPKSARRTHQAQQLREFGREKTIVRARRSSWRQIW